MDKVDINPRYLENADISWWHIFIEQFYREQLFTRNIPNGAIVEVGVFRCFSFQLLCNYFGAERCYGYDIVNYTRHPRVNEIDVRQLSKADDRPIAVGLNECSSWADSPQSKKAACIYLTRNIVEGGYYLDQDREMISEEVDMSKFETVFTVPKLLTLFRKKSSAGEF